MSDTQTQEEPTLPQPAPQATPGILGRYLRDSRKLLNNLVLVTPLFLIYQVGILSTGGIRNGVDFITPLIYQRLLGGVLWKYLLFNLGVTAALGAAIYFLRRFQQMHPRTFLLMLLEGTTYGLVLGSLVHVILQQLQIPMDSSHGEVAQLGTWANFALSLGAGFYEELVFRLILMSGSVWLIQGFLRLREASQEAQPSGWAKLRRSFLGPAEGESPPPELDLPTRILLVGGAIVATSLLFSAIHYTGSLGDELTLYSFMFRFVAGVIFASLFYLRGFAVAVYTHAIYDVIVLVF